MDRLSNNSKTSLEGDFEESIQFDSYQEYIENLKNNNKIITMALRKAEDLIYEYQHQNQQLKNKNKSLQKKLAEQNMQIERLREIVLKQNDYKMEDKLVDLSQRNEKAEKRLINLMDELEKSQLKVAKLTKFKQQKTQKNLHNYFEFGTPKSTYANNPRQQQLKKQIRSLKWKLQQREQEITYMIKRNKILQQKSQYHTINTHKGSAQKQFKKHIDDSRFYTCETQPNKTPKTPNF